MLLTEVVGQGAMQSNWPASPGSPFIGIETQLPVLQTGYNPDLTRRALAAPQPSRHRGGLSPRALRKVRDFIEAHMDENVSIQVLADAVGLSMYHFARAFKQSEGVTPHDYLVQRRVKRAQQLLAETDLPLSEIAVAVGFADQSHCARRFRELVGLTPRRYRWSMR